MCGRQIHQAAQALHTLRDAALGEAGITFVQSKVLDAVPSGRDELIHRLAGLTMTDPTEIATATDESRTSSRAIWNGSAGGTTSP